MNASKNYELASIEANIKRATAMIEMCEKWNAGEEALEEARAQLRQAVNEKAALLGTTVRPDYEHQERLGELFSRMFETVHN